MQTKRANMHDSAIFQLIFWDRESEGKYAAKYEYVCEIVLQSYYLDYPKIALDQQYHYSWSGQTSY